MGILKPLLVIYLIFVMGSLGFLFYSNAMVESTQFAPGSFDQMRAVVQHSQNLPEARENIEKFINLVEQGEQNARDRSLMNNFYICFAIIMSLPLAAYTGQSMRDNLFVTRLATMPHLVFWALWGVSTRATAVRFMRLSFLFAVISLGMCFYHPLGYFGLFALVPALVYRYAVKWIDKNSYWASATRTPF
jgi:hypothetical protein